MNLLICTIFLSIIVLIDADFCGDKPDGTYGDPEVPCKTSFIVCTNQQLYTFNCPNNLYYNADLDSCDHFKNVVACSGTTAHTIVSTVPRKPVVPVPSTNPNFCNNLANGMYAPPGVQCASFFYHCSNHQTFVQPCPPTVFWNDAKKICDYGYNIPGCAGYTGGSAPVTLPTPAASTSIATESTNSPRPTTSGTLEPYTTNPTFCIERKNGTYAVPGVQCATSFYSCSNYLTYVMECPADTNQLYWNDGKKQCDYGYNIPGCGEKPHSPPHSPPTSPHSPPHSPPTSPHSPPHSPPTSPHSPPHSPPTSPHSPPHSPPTSPHSPPHSPPTSPHSPPHSPPTSPHSPPHSPPTSPHSPPHSPPTRPITPGPCNDLSIDLMFLLDHSRSIDEQTQWPLVLNFVKDIVKNFQIGMDETLVSVSRFADKADIQFCFDAHTDKAELIDAILNLPYSPPGATGIGVGLQEIRDHVLTPTCSSRGNRSILVLMTDGANNLKPEPEPVANQLRNRGIDIYAVGIQTKELDVKTLIEITGSDSRVLNGTYDDLTAFAGQISASVCVSTTPVLDTTEPAVVTTPVVCHNDSIDLMFLLDHSTSIDEHSQWPLIRNFVKDIVDNFDIGTGATLVSVSRFASDADTSFCFDKHTNIDDLVKAITSLPYGPRGHTAIGTGLKQILNTVLKPSCGYRGYRPTLVLITDGGNDEGPDPISIASQLRHKGVAIYAVGIQTYDLDVNALIEITGDRSRVLNGSYDELHAFANKISTSACATTTPPPETTEHIITTEIDTTPMPVTTVTPLVCHNDSIDLMFLLDHSRSINKNTQWPLVRNFVKDIVQNFQIGRDNTLVSVSRFADDADIQFCFDDHTDKSELIHTIVNIPYDPPGATGIGIGLKEIRDRVIHSSCGYRGYRPTLVLITDGGNNLKPEPVPIARQLRNAGIAIYAVGIQTFDLDVKTLIEITGDESRVLNGTYDDLTAFAHQISTSACASTTPSTPPLTTPATTACTPGNIELVYLIDESESITNYDFHNQIKPFLVAVTTNLAATHSIGTDSLRVAMVWFSSYLDSPDTGARIHEECGIEFDLNEVGSLPDFDVKIQGAKFNLGVTDTSCGFNLVRNEVFTAAHGDRSGAQRILVVVTDGRPNIGDPMDPSPIAREIRDSGATILTVGVTDEINEAELLDWTGGYRDQLFIAHNFTNLDNKLAEVVAETIDNKSRICPTPACQQPPFNLAYLVDESESVLSHFDTVKQFLRNVTDNVTNELDAKSQIAMAWFSQHTIDHLAAEVEFQWARGQYTVDQLIDNSRFHMGGTNLYAGLEAARTGLFGATNPLLDPNYQNVLLLFTDGSPNLPTDVATARQMALDSARKLRNEATIIVVAIDSCDLDRIFLQDLVGAGGTVLIAETYANLEELTRELFINLNPCMG